MGQSHAVSGTSPGVREAPWEALAAQVVGPLGVAPAAVVAAAARRDDGRWVRGSGAAGRLTYAPDAPTVSTSTPFDLASLTKPLTALAALRLAQAGQLDLDAPLASLSPRFARTAAAARPLALLLRHRAGLEAHRALFAPLVEGREIDRDAAFQEAADAVRAECQGPLAPEGAPAVYSDLGYLLAGAALEDVTGVSLDALMEREVSSLVDARMGSARRLRATDSTFDGRVAPTEVVDFRGGLVRGAVHDENAWALAGDGTCGHAGTFGTALDVLALGEALLDALAGARPDWLHASTLEAALAPWPGGSHVLGFDTKTGPPSSSGSRFGSKTFGHLGFTGTSLWIDPVAGFVGVLLTNRVHPSREHVAIRAARPVVYDAIAELLSEALRSAG